jgi:hypothetical protein
MCVTIRLTVIVRPTICNHLPASVADAKTASEARSPGSESLNYQLSKII